MLIRMAKFWEAMNESCVTNAELQFSMQMLCTYHMNVFVTQLVLCRQECKRKTRTVKSRVLTRLV